MRSRSLFHAALATSLFCNLGVTAFAQKTDVTKIISSEVAEFQHMSSWVAPDDKDPAATWSAKIQANLNNPEWVKKACGSNYTGRQSEQTSADLSRISMQEIQLTNLCLSELQNAGVKSALLSDFQKKFGDAVLHAYISDDGRGHPKIRYFTAEYMCHDSGTGDAEKTVTKRGLHFGAGMGSDLQKTDSGEGCPATQPFKSVDKFKVVLQGWSETKTVPGKYKESFPYVVKLDTGAWKKEAEEKVRVPLRRVVGELEKRIKQKRDEVELELQRRPLFAVPSEGAPEDNFAFVIDRTGSFKGSFAAAVDELKKSVQNYPKDKSFSLAFFGSKVGSAQYSNDDLFEGGSLVPATDQNKKRALEWLETQKTYQPSGKGLVRNEYAVGVLNKLKSTNSGKKINYRYYGDGKISIDSDSTATAASKTERQKQFEFAQSLSDGSKFTYTPMSSDYSKEFADGLGNKAEILLPGNNIVSSEDYFAKIGKLKNEAKTLQGDWETVARLKDGLLEELPFQKDYDSWKKTNSSSARTNYEMRLSSIKTASSQIEPLIVKYGKANDVDLGFKDFKYKSVSYSLGVSNDDLFKECPK